MIMYMVFASSVKHKIYDKTFVVVSHLDTYLTANCFTQSITIFNISLLKQYF